MVMPCLEPVLTIAASVPCAIMAGAKAWTPLMTPQRLTSSVRRQMSYFSHGPAPVMTALRPAARAGWSVMAGLLFFVTKDFCHQRKDFCHQRTVGQGNAF